MGDINFYNIGVIIRVWFVFYNSYFDINRVIFDFFVFLKYFFLK